MTTVNRAAVSSDQSDEFIVFPDPPEIPEDKMTNFDHLAANGNVHHLIIHFGNPDTNLVAGERYLALAPTRDMTGLRYPDLLIAFNVDPETYRRRRAYVIEDQGKPPDFVLEVASPSTRRIDATAKRLDYAALGIPEYWRFDEEPTRRGPRLAGDQLVDGEYQPIPIEEVAEGVLQGYSAVLDLHTPLGTGPTGVVRPSHRPAYHHLRGRTHPRRPRRGRTQRRAGGTRRVRNASARTGGGNQAIPRSMRQGHTLCLRVCKRAPQLQRALVC